MFVIVSKNSTTYANSSYLAKHNLYSKLKMNCEELRNKSKRNFNFKIKIHCLYKKEKNAPPVTDLKHL